MKTLPGLKGIEPWTSLWQISMTFHLQGFCSYALFVCCGKRCEELGWWCAGYPQYVHERMIYNVKARSLGIGICINDENDTVAWFPVTESTSFVQNMCCHCIKCKQFICFIRYLSTTDIFYWTIRSTVLLRIFIGWDIPWRNVAISVWAPHSLGTI